MTDGIMISIGDDGVARMYDDTYDITIHCETQAEHDEVLKILRGSQWIPCSERMPDTYTTVLVTHRGGVVSFAWYTGEYWTRGSMSKYKMLMTVKAWKPLPDPYEGE